MTFKETIDKIESSDVFQKFKQENPDAELCAGFFIIDFLSNDSKKSLDYKIKDRETRDKIFTFDLNDKDEISMKQDKLVDIPNAPKLEVIDKEIKVELEQLPSIAEDQALTNKIGAKFHKIIAVLQKYKDPIITKNEEKQTWNLTCMLEHLIILHILIDSKTGDIMKFERKSMMDMIRKK